jgi:hypothetical protein
MAEPSSDGAAVKHSPGDVGLWLVLTKLEEVCAVPVCDDVVCDIPPCAEEVCVVPACDEEVWPALPSVVECDCRDVETKLYVIGAVTTFVDVVPPWLCPVLGPGFDTELPV